MTMQTQNKIRALVIGIVLLFSIGPIHVSAEIDHVHFGSTGNPLQGLTVTWRGNYSHCRIKWGYTESYEKGSVDVGGRIDFGDKDYYLFDYRFSDLEPSKIIHYAFQEYNTSYDCFNYTGEWSKDYTFQTSADIKSTRFTFIAGGDSRGEMCCYKMPGWQMVANALAAANTEFYLYMGDLGIMGGDKDVWATWYDSGRNFLSQKLVYYSVGNHEAYGDPGLRNYLDQLTSPENGNFSELYYSFEFGNAVFITLNTSYDPQSPKDKAAMAQQNTWLAAQLEEYRGPKTKNFKEWVIVSFHKPFFTIDKHMGEITGNIRAEKSDFDLSKTWWKDLFDKYGVDVIINGHTHLYMRTVPISLLGTGPNGTDITFDSQGLPSSPVKKVKYGNKKGEGRLEIVAGGFGVKVLAETDICRLKDEWYVDNYKLEFHYCEFVIDGKVLEMRARKVSDNSIMDQVTITH
jgi:hypothetical protein